MLKISIFSYVLFYFSNCIASTVENVYNYNMLFYCKGSKDNSMAMTWWLSYIETLRIEFLYQTVW